MLVKENRITKKKEFDSFFGKEFKQKRGVTLFSSSLILKYYPITSDQSRVGFIINNKIDKRATTRNEIKRKLRETIRLNLKIFKGVNDVLILAKPSITKLDKVQLEQELINLLKKAKII